MDILSADSPSALDPALLANFTSWRTRQRENLAALLSAPERIKVFCGPTGSGKSLVYMAYGAARAAMAKAGQRPHRTLVVTSSRHLQDQILRDFPAAFLFKGKTNYPCHLQGGWPNDCGDSAPCHSGVSKCALQGTTCAYYQARRTASRVPLVVINYHLWAGIAWGEESEGEGLGQFNTVIFDEAHNIRNIVTAAVAPLIPHPLLEDLELPRPAKYKSLSAWIRWIDEGPVLDRMAQADEYREAIRDGHDLTVHESKRFRKLKALERLTAKLRIIGPHAKDGPSWVLTEGVEGHRNNLLFQPLAPAPYCEKIIYRGVKDILLTSATITPASLAFIGLPAAKDRYFLETPSTFPVPNRRFTLAPLAKIDSKLPESGWDEIIAAIAKFLRSRVGRRGLFHVTSYEKGVRVAHGLGEEFRSRVVLQERGRLNEAVHRYLSLPDGFLISPAISEGLDLPGDKCAFNILLKTPFPDTRDPLTRARGQFMPQLTHLEMAEKIEQSVGRGCRSQDDFCENYILDTHFRQWVYQKVAPYLTSSFRAGVQALSGPWPPPAPPLPWASKTPVPVRTPAVQAPRWGGKWPLPPSRPVPSPPRRKGIFAEP